MNATPNDDYWIDLGRCAVACPRWRWLKGTLGQRRDDFGRSWARVLSLCGGSVRYEETGEHGRYTPTVDGSSFSAAHIPDLRDPATLGCLLALVEEAHGFPVCAYQPRISHGHGWLVESVHDHGERLATDKICETRAEALVRALETAP